MEYFFEYYLSKYGVVFLSNLKARPFLTTIVILIALGSLRLTWSDKFTEYNLCLTCPRITTRIKKKEGIGLTTI